MISQNPEYEVIVPEEHEDDPVAEAVDMLAHQLHTQMSILSEQVSSIAASMQTAGREYEFLVRRDSQGFITGIHAKPVVVR